MSEPSAKQKKSHPLRLAVMMLCGALFGPFVFGFHGGEIGGAILGFCIEMLRRGLEWAASRRSPLAEAGAVLMLVAIVAGFALYIALCRLCR